MALHDFRTTDYSKRTATVKTPLDNYPSLAPFFKNGEPQEFQVRALTGEEVYRAEHRITINKNLPRTVETLFRSFSSQNTDAILKAMGLGEEVPDQLVYEIAVVEFGVIRIGGEEAQLAQDDVVKLFANCTEPARKIARRIFALSGMGNVPKGESNASGTTPESKTP